MFNIKMLKKVGLPSSFAACATHSPSCGSSTYKIRLINADVWYILAGVRPNLPPARHTSDRALLHYHAVDDDNAVHSRTLAACKSAEILATSPLVYR